MSDLLRTLAFAYRRKGADAMPSSDLRMLLAFSLGWFAPADAKRLVERATNAGFLIAEGESLRLAFAADSVDVPLNFRPTPGVLEEPFPEMPAARTAPAPPSPVPSVDDDDAATERARRGGLLSLDAARLVVARRNGVDVAPLLADAERALFAPR